MTGGKIMPKTKGSKNRNSTKLELEFLEHAKKMPPLYHTLPGEDFDMSKSEVANWLIKQPLALHVLFQLIKNVSCKNHAIEYDSNTGKWQGVDYEEIIHDGSFSNCAICDNHTCEDGYCSWDE